MESVQKELTMLLEQLLPNDTRIGLRLDYANHKTWNDYGTDLVRLGNDGVRAHRICLLSWMIAPQQMGRNHALDCNRAAFDDPETDAVYMLSDGRAKQGSLRRLME